MTTAELSQSLFQDFVRVLQDRDPSLCFALPGVGFISDKVARAIVGPLEQNMALTRINEAYYAKDLDKSLRSQIRAYLERNLELKRQKRFAAFVSVLKGEPPPLNSVDPPRECRKVEELTLSIDKITDSEMSELVATIVHCKQVIRIDLQALFISNEGLRALTEALESNFTIISLKIKASVFSARIDIAIRRNKELVREAARRAGLERMLSGRKAAWFDECTIFDSEAQEIAEAISSTETLNYLDLSVVELFFDGMNLILDAIQANKTLTCVLTGKNFERRLPGSANQIAKYCRRNDNWQRFRGHVERLRNKDRTLTSVKVEQIHDKELEELAKVMKGCQFVRSLHVKSCYVTNRGARLFADALACGQFNKHLIMVFQWTDITNEGAHAIADALIATRHVGPLSFVFFNDNKPSVPLETLRYIDCIQSHNLAVGQLLRGREVIDKVLETDACGLLPPVLQELILQFFVSDDRVVEAKSLELALRDAGIYRELCDERGVLKCESFNFHLAAYELNKTPIHIVFVPRFDFNSWNFCPSQPLGLPDALLDNSFQAKNARRVGKKNVSQNQQIPLPHHVLSNPSLSGGSGGYNNGNSRSSSIDGSRRGSSTSGCNNGSLDAASPRQSPAAPLEAREASAEFRAVLEAVKRKVLSMFSASNKILLASFVRRYSSQYGGTKDLDLVLKSFSLDHFLFTHCGCIRIGLNYFGLPKTAVS